jgi:cellulose synthase/poly-beta-1,6-N-acetylglucosamine synthase-like glycosyltransferase
LLLIALIAAPLASVILFVRPRPRTRSQSGVWPASRRFVLALAGTAMLALIGGVAVRLIGVSDHNTVAAAAGLVIASLVWLPLTRRWNARSHLCWASSIFLFVIYLAYVLDWTFASHLGVAGTIGGLLLWLFEVVAAVMACAYLWEICDALGTEDWRRRVPATALPELPAGQAPLVSLHVPAHNEPPDMVMATLRALTRLDYPRFEIILIDDNTDDERLWRPVQEWCARHQVKFAHLEDWPGYKSGALNYALREMTDERAEIIGVVDSDYLIEPEFLRRSVPLFGDRWVGFTQAPQDYRGWGHARYYRRLYYSYKYFFAVSQPSRNERNGAIFAGTMGLIRRVALDALGGWDEWCITEDAELSLRLLRAGWGGLHVDQALGRGIMPLTFEALKGQRYRWCFGGIQILRMHWKSLMPGRATKQNRLTTGQRWSYLSGVLQWYGDLLGLLFLVFLLAGALDLAAGGGGLFRKLTIFLAAAVPVLFLLGLVRAVALLRRGTGASWRDAIGAFFIWQSTSLVVARASVLGLFARKAAFLRTPKTSERERWWQALRANWAESTLALAGLAGIAAALTKATQISGPLLAGLLVLPTVGLAAAPVNSWAAQRAALPPDLRRRRQTEYARDRSRAVAGRAALVGVGGLIGTVIAAAVLLGAPGPAPRQSPPLLPPTHKGPSPQASHSTPAKSPKPSPTSSSPSTPATHSSPATGTSSPPTSPSASPTPSPSPSPSPSPTSGPNSSPNPGGSP